MNTKFFNFFMNTDQWPLSILDRGLTLRTRLNWSKCALVGRGVWNSSAENFRFENLGGCSHSMATGIQTHYFKLFQEIPYIILFSGNHSIGQWPDDKTNRTIHHSWPQMAERKSFKELPNKGRQFKLDKMTTLCPVKIFDFILRHIIMLYWCGYEVHELFTLRPMLHGCMTLHLASTIK